MKLPGKHLSSMCEALASIPSSSFFQERRGDLRDYLKSIVSLQSIRVLEHRPRYLSAFL